MKDDYHLPVITRLEREARRQGIKKAKLAMVLGLSNREYNYLSDGWDSLSITCLTPYTYNLFTSMGIDLFYVLTGVHRNGLCMHCQEKLINRWVNDIPLTDRYMVDHLVTRIRYGM
ncbi:TPA: hypothetical protein N3A33_001093 [Salmonella enterica subsp. salamae serovar 28:r:e,n,z15]|nr:hypothetical protein [Salmonella enterica subsp. salamae serovar 28:r:e,n,z15]